MKKFLITLFLGWSGLHKFMEKRIGLGILYFCTGGLFTIGWIIDTIKSGLDLLKHSPRKNIQVLPSEFNVAGTSYLQPAIISVVTPNPDYGTTTIRNKRIYKYKFTRKTAVLLPEPTNSHDRNAVLVQIDGVKVGYIPREFCTAIKQRMSFHSSLTVSAQIYGGDYKYIDETGYSVEQADSLEVKINI